MMVITRRPQEAILLTLEDGREIIVSNYGNHRTKFGVTAARSIKVQRIELAATKQRGRRPPRRQEQRIQQQMEEGKQ